MRWIKIAALAALLQLLLLGGASAQTQMLLPYNQAIFQGTWENVAVRPQHRFSLGLPVLSSVELGVINNGFTLDKVSQLRSNALYVQGDMLLKELKKNDYNLTFAEQSFDLLHFRMAWRNYYFWFGARTVLNQSLLYANDMAEFAIAGNKQFIGKTLEMSDMALNSNIYHEFTLGFSRVVDNLIVGARLSFLTGLANVNFNPSKIELSISDKDENLYAHTANAEASAKVSGVPIEVKNNLPTLASIKTKDIKWVNFSNPGVALAAAVAWRPEPKTNLTFAFSDLGFISWSDKITELTVKTGKVYFDGFQGFGKMLRSGTFDPQILSSRFINPFGDKGEGKTETKAGGSYLSWLSPKFHLMATYDIARQTTAGVSFSGIIHQKQFYPSVTLSIQQGFSNLFHFQLAASYNQRSFLNFGGGLVFCPGPIQFYVVTDNFFAFIKPTMAKATNIRLGVNIVWGAFYPNNDQLTHE